MQFSEIMNIALGGSLLATVIGVLTLKATVHKAHAEAEKVKAEAENMRMDNAEKATRILINNIVEPLKDELNATRKDLQATKREMARLRKAIDTANACRHRDDCPVLDGMRELQKSDANHPDGNPAKPHRQHADRDQNDPERSRADVGGKARTVG